jgi:hypothetical protein
MLMAVAIDLRPYVGQWIAQTRNGEIVAADTLDALVRKLIEKYGCTEDRLPAIEHVPEDIAATFLL